jgi:hypothetical protein
MNATVTFLAAHVVGLTGGLDVWSLLRRTFAKPYTNR